MLKASRSSLSDASAFIRSAGFSSSSCWPSSDRGIKAHVTGVQMFQNIQTETNISQHLSKFSENLEYFFLPNFQTWGYHTKSTEDDILSKKEMVNLQMLVDLLPLWQWRLQKLRSLLELYQSSAFVAGSARSRLLPGLELGADPAWPPNPQHDGWSQRFWARRRVLQHLAPRKSELNQLRQGS